MVKIPNYNSISTLIDRLSVENAKLVQFEEKGNMQDSMRAQEVIVSALRVEFEFELHTIFETGKYEVLDEKRTFN